MIPSCFAGLFLAAALTAAMPSQLRAQAAPSPAMEAVTIQRAPGQLSGTLLVPHASGKIPVVLLIAGSGPTDRDGNAPGVRPASLRQLAESLAAHGIASLRFDKRGVGASASATIPEPQLTFELMADDAAAWLRSLASDSRFSRVVVAGHSDGALVGLLALRRAPAAGYVSIEGAARPADEVLHDQLARQLSVPLVAQADTTMARLKRGMRVDSLPPMLAGLFRPSVQPYLTSWFAYSGRNEIPRITVPCLVVQGSHDLQVAPEEADLLQKANPRCRIAMITGMNHVLKQAPPDMAGQMGSYTAPDAVLAPGLVGAIVAFINAAGK